MGEEYERNRMYPLSSYRQQPSHLPLPERRPSAIHDPPACVPSSSFSFPHRRAPPSQLAFNAVASSSRHAALHSSSFSRNHQLIPSQDPVAARNRRYSNNQLPSPSRSSVASSSSSSSSAPPTEVLPSRPAKKSRLSNDSYSSSSSNIEPSNRPAPAPSFVPRLPSSAPSHHQSSSSRPYHHPYELSHPSPYSVRRAPTSLASPSPSRSPIPLSLGDLSIPAAQQPNPTPQHHRIDLRRAPRAAQISCPAPVKLQKRKEVIDLTSDEEEENDFEIVETRMEIATVASYAGGQKDGPGHGTDDVAGHVGREEGQGDARKDDDIEILKMKAKFGAALAYEHRPGGGEIFNLRDGDEGREGARVREEDDAEVGKDEEVVPISLASQPPLAPRPLSSVAQPAPPNPSQSQCRPTVIEFSSDEEDEDEIEVVRTIERRVFQLSASPFVPPTPSPPPQNPRPPPQNHRSTFSEPPLPPLNPLPSPSNPSFSPAPNPSRQHDSLFESSSFSRVSTAASSFFQTPPPSGSAGLREWEDWIYYAAAGTRKGKIRAENDVDGQVPPGKGKFVYGEKNLTGKGFGIRKKGEEDRVRCPCEDGEARGVIKTVVNGMAILHDDFIPSAKNVRIVVEQCVCFSAGLSHQPHHHCRNPSKCPNNLIDQTGAFSLVVFRRDGVGWALKSDDDIPKGTFLGIYAGKVFRLKETGEEVEGQGEDEEELNEEDLGLEFIYELDGTLKRTEDGRLEEGQWAHYMIDAREQAGNWTRWYNHTCFNPNVNAITVKTVFDWSRGEVIPLIGFVAIQDIPAGTELTLNYRGLAPRDDLSEAQLARIARLERPCRCGANNCLGKLWFLGEEGGWEEDEPEDAAEKKRRAKRKGKAKQWGNGKKRKGR